MSRERQALPQSQHDGLVFSFEKSKKGFNKASGVLTCAAAARGVRNWAASESLTTKLAKQKRTTPFRKVNKQKSLQRSTRAAIIFWCTSRARSQALGTQQHYR